MDWITVMFFLKLFALWAPFVNGVEHTEKVYLTHCTTIVGKSEDCFESFLGIPYGKAPVGALRFKDPVPFPLWKGNRMATDETNSCWQVDPMLGIPLGGTEDCLNLHIYRPRSWRKSPKPLPVAFFIHGGGLYSGTNNLSFYGPDYVMDTQQMILVAPQYRVNVFGFLATGDEAATGNYGLKDLLMALRWTNEHIGAFGGDAREISIFGQSGGSVACNYILLNQESKGLYKNVYMMSGIATAKWSAPFKDPREYINKHARAMGISAPEELSNQAIVDVFREMPAEALTKGIFDMKDWANYPVTSYIPAVEPKGTPGAFLTEHPMTLLEQGNFVNVPIMAHMITFDGICFVCMVVRDKVYPELNENMLALLPVLLLMDEENVRVPEVVRKVQGKYFGPNGIVEDEEQFRGLVDMVTDYFFVGPFLKTMDLFSKHNKYPVYAFQYRYLAERSVAPIFIGEAGLFPTPVHGDELLALFLIEGLAGNFSKIDKENQDNFFRNMMDFFFTNDPGFEPWRAHNLEFPALGGSFSTQSSWQVLSTSPYYEKMEFWDYMDQIVEDGEKPCPSEDIPAIEQEAEKITGNAKRRT